MRPPSSFWTDFGGGVAPAPAWRKETKGIIATYMALVLRSPWKLNTTWRFRTISDLTAMDVMGNVEHEPQTWFSYVFIIFIHSIQWNPLKTCLLSPSVPIKGLRSKKTSNRRRSDWDLFLWLIIRLRSQLNLWGSTTVREFSFCDRPETSM